MSKIKSLLTNVTCETITDMYLLWLFTFQLFYMDGNYFERYFGVKKINLMLVSSVVYIVLFLVIALKTHRKFELSPNLGVTIAMLSVYTILTVLSSMQSPYYKDTIFGVFSSGGFVNTIVFLFVFIAVAQSARLTVKKLQVLGIVLMLECFIVFLQIAGFNPFYLYGSSNYYGEGLVTNIGMSCAGTLGNINVISNLLCVTVLFLSVNIAVARTTLLHKAPVISSSVIQLVALIVLSCALGVVGFGAGLFALVCYIALTSKSAKLKWGLGLSLVTFSVGLLVLIYFWDPGRSFMHELHKMMHGNIDYRFGTGRLKIWKDYLSRAKGNIFLGFGADISGYYNLGFFQRYDEALGVLFKARAIDAHNVYINVLFSSGAVALTSYVGAIVYCARNAFQQRDAGAVAAIVAWATSSFFCVTTPMTQIYFTILLAFSFCSKEDALCTKSNGC